MTLDDLTNELEFTRYADKLLEKIAVHAKLIYGQNLSGKERVKLATELLRSRVSE